MGGKGEKDGERMEWEMDKMGKERGGVGEGNNEKRDK